MNKCLATTRQGQQCKRNKQPNQDYCYQHITPPTSKAAIAAPKAVVAAPKAVVAAPKAVVAAPKAVVAAPKMLSWADSLKQGQIDQIRQHMKTHDFNQPCIFDRDPATQQGPTIYPLHFLYWKKHLRTLCDLLDDQTININVLDHRGLQLMDLLLTIGGWCPRTIRLELINKIITRSDFKFDHCFSFIFSYNTVAENLHHDPDKYRCAALLLAHPRIDVNRTITIHRETVLSKGHIGQLLSDHLNDPQPEEILSLLRVLLSRNDIKVNQIIRPHHLLLPYLKFYHLKQQILAKRHTRRQLLSKPETWTPWQKIAYRLQTPPITPKDKAKLIEYGRLIGYNQPNASPIMICVELAKHYDHNRKTLTWDHHLSIINDSDLFGNSMNDLPLEYIVVDDDKYGFNISEFNEVIKLKRHPYTGKNWSQVTIQGLSFIAHQINPIHLIHQMTVAIDDPVTSTDEQSINRLMEYYSYITHPICQMYADNPRCRIELLKLINFPTDDDVTFSEFVENMIGHLISFPIEHRGQIRQQIYRYFEICQMYA